MGKRQRRQPMLARQPPMGARGSLEPGDPPSSPGPQSRGVERRHNPRPRAGRPQSTLVPSPPCCGSLCEAHGIQQQPCCPWAEHTANTWSQTAGHLPPCDLRPVPSRPQCSHLHGGVGGSQQEDACRGQSSEAAPQALMGLPQHHGCWNCSHGFHASSAELFISVPATGQGLLGSRQTKIEPELSC